MLDVDIKQMRIGEDRIPVESGATPPNTVQALETTELPARTGVMIKVKSHLQIMPGQSVLFEQKMKADDPDYLMPRMLLAAGKEMMVRVINVKPHPVKIYAHQRLRTLEAVQKIDVMAMKTGDDKGDGTSESLEGLVLDSETLNPTQQKELKALLQKY